MKIEIFKSFIERFTKSASAKLNVFVFFLSMMALLSSTSVSGQYVSKEIAIHRLSTELVQLGSDLQSLIPFTDQYRYTFLKARYYKMMVSDLRLDQRGVAETIDYNLQFFPNTPNSGQGFSTAEGQTASQSENTMSKTDRLKMENEARELLAL